MPVPKSPESRQRAVELARLHEKPVAAIASGCRFGGFAFVTALRLHRPQQCPRPILDELRLCTLGDLSRTGELRPSVGRYRDGRARRAEDGT